jgi:hypothetical protein
MAESTIVQERQAETEALAYRGPPLPNVLDDLVGQSVR